ncbi:hypothetical protein INT43_006354 [Umbelopsis isabellina]|uniref:S1-like domain-containing protein n=1 Tax=Mortierella isabellina TaxID=91625 RepID=A0A8H7Q1I7_MORIS|nr:hypothetical protein INT43_006354 [Umbelopsis isabellina]
MGKKQTTRDAESTPELTDNQLIARVLGPRGKNMHEVQFADGRISLAILPPRFRNLIWVKRGHYVIVDPKATTTEKLGGEIVHVLFPEHVKDLKSQGKWQVVFGNALITIVAQSNVKKDSSADKEDGSDSSDNDDDLFVNNNRPVLEETESEDDSDEESEEEGEQS